MKSRRDHNNSGQRKIRTGKTALDIIAIGQRLGIPVVRPNLSPKPPLNCDAATNQRFPVTRRTEFPK